MLISAALIGSGVGLSLGAAYLAGGMARHAQDHSRVEQMAQAAAGGYSQELGQAPGAVMLPSVARERVDDERLSAAEKRARELDCLTQAVYYEARGEDPRGQFAVAQVVMNRVKHPAFPKTVCGVVFQGAGRKGCQFSFACDGSMRRGREMSAWKRARRVAARALSGAAIAEIGSATHFHTTAVSPAWGPQMRKVAQVGMHVFYKFAPRKAAPATTAAAVVEQAVMTSAPAVAPNELRLAPALIEAVVHSGPQLGPTEGAPPAAADAKPAQPAPAPAAKPAEAAALATPQHAAASAS